MQKILFPTDFSAAADHAFIYALKVAEHLKAEINTVHVYHLPYIQAGNLPRTLREVYDSIVIETFENYRSNVPHLRKIADEHGLSHITIKHAMVESKRDVVSTLLNFAERGAYDFIIMGTTGASGLKEIFLGSVAAEMLENASCPVMAVPEKAVFDGHLDKILMTTEFAENEKIAFRRVLDFADSFGAHVSCAHVDTGHTERYTHRMDKLRNDFTGVKNLSFEVIDATNVERALAEYIERNGIDILAMLTHKRNFIQELFTYSLTKKMANHLKVPVLALHEGYPAARAVKGEAVSDAQI